MLPHAWGAPRAPRGSSCAAAQCPPPCFSGCLWFGAKRKFPGRAPQTISKRQQRPSQWCPKPENGVPKSMKKRSKWTPKRCFWTPKRHKMATVRPKLHFRGPETDLGAKKRVNGTKKESQNGAKMGNKSIEKRMKNQCDFEGRFGE